MKKSLLALAALTAFAGVASAQSSVTLFGIVDVNARNVKNGSAGSLKTLSQDGIASSRLGFRGVEDMGGGLKAGFWLEGAIQPDVGTSAGQSWQRRSTLSLMGGFGELRLGRDYTPDFWNHTVFDPFGTNGVASSVNIFPSIATTVRTNNTVGYFLPAMGGLYGQVQLGAAEGPTGTKHTGGRLGYAAGPVNVAVAYGKTDIGSTSYKRLNAGASFKMGAATLLAQYTKGDASGLGRDVTHWNVGTVIAMGAGNLKLSYGNSDGPTNVDATQFGVGYDYALSKRTALYGTYASVDNKAGAAYVIGGGPAVGTRTGFKSTGYEFGVRHTF
jgi:predicted porin